MPASKKNGVVRLVPLDDGYGWERYHPDGTLVAVSGGDVAHATKEIAAAHAQREADSFGGKVEDP